MVNICKSFGVIQALKNVNLSVNYNEVLGLLGDNGAGKSTLIKILVGLYPPDSGEIYFEGKKCRFSSPKEARENGIEIVYQELALVELMNIWRNFFLGRELIKKKIGPLSLLDKKKMREISFNSLKEIGVRIRAPDESVLTLSGGERQSIAIGRAIKFGVKLLILDEPTASLSIKESRKTLEYVKKAKEHGLSVIFITHNIYHVYPVADRFVILDRGVKIGEFYKKDVTPEDVIEIISKGAVEL
jgi:simple sugar transport system ATP-binding protein